MSNGADVVIVTAWYPPEPAPFGQMMLELARQLGASGMKVEIITNVPSHPLGRPYPGFRNRLFQREESVQNVRVLRLGIVPRLAGAAGPPGRVQRILAFLWFTVASCLTVLLRRRPRVIFAVMQPLTVAVPLVAVGRWRRSKVVFSVQDLHPDALVDLGLIRNRFLISALRSVERFAYRHADSLVVICNAFRDHCIARGADPARVAVIPNWIDVDEVRPQGRRSALRTELCLDDGAFVALYAGTIGLVSGADVLIDALAMLPPDSGVQAVFVGEGQLVATLKHKAARSPARGVHFLPFQPRDKLNDVQALGDVSVVTLLPGHGRTSVPSKVLGYMAAARPVIAAVDADSETARLIRAAGAGWVVPPADPAALASALREARDDVAARRRYGAAGRDYLEAHHGQQPVLYRYTALLREVAGR